MPLTSFLGISTIMHIVLIAVYKLFKLRPLGEHSRLRKAGLGFKTGFVIVVMIFSYVSTSAAFLIMASAIESHSSFNIVRNYTPALNEIFDIDPNVGTVALTAYEKTIDHFIIARIQPVFSASNFEEFLIYLI